MKPSKLSYIHKIGEKPLQYITTGKLLEDAAYKFGDRKALISKHQNQSLNFSEILVQADKLAAGFHKIGLKRFDRVGIWAANLIEWYITKMACARAGLTLVCINPVYQPPEVKFCINKVKMKAIVCAQKLKNFDYYENLLKVVPDLEKSEPGQLRNKKVPSLRTVITINDKVKPGTYNYDEILNLASIADVVKIQKFQDCISPDDPTLIQFTSGTTGKPKAVSINHFGSLNQAYIFGKKNGFHHKHQIICAQLPFFHIFGTMGNITAGLHFGSTSVLPTDAYDSNKSLNAIKEERCTIVYGTPTMFVDLIETQEKRKEEISLETAVVGGAICAPELMKKMSKVLKIKTIHSVYGLTEASGGIFQSPLFEEEEEEENTLKTVGRVNEHVEVKVVDKNGRMVPFGTVGELCVRSFCNMSGYWGDEERTKEAKGDDGWLKTGDQFILDKDGYGRIVGRLKDIIIRGGENIFPKEIEEFLLAHPDIIDVQVIGTPHERLGEEVCACIRIKANKTVTLENIANFCKGKLAYFKIPSKIQIVDEFPKTTSGKVQKFKLREMITK